MFAALTLLLACAGPAGSKSTGSEDDTGRLGHAADSGEPCEQLTFYEDVDGDGFGVGERMACEAPAGFAVQGGDCDDTADDVFPGATELCNGRDDDCDGELDPEALMQSLYLDADGDGYGDGVTALFGCPDDGAVVDGCDCDDADPDANVDPLACPPLECPEDGGIWQRGACGDATQVEHDGAIVLTDDAALTMCAGSHSVSVTVSTDRVRIYGVGREDTLWGTKPALVIDQEGAAVEISGLSLFGGTYSGSGGAGVLLDARAGGVDLRMSDVILGKTTAGVANVSVIEVDGDLTLTDSQLMRILMGFGDVYSTSCSQVGVRVTGDLELVRTDVSEFTAGCSSWSHSAYNSATATGIAVGGDVRLEDVTLTDFSVLSASSGVAADGILHGLSVGGDLTAVNLSATDNVVSTDVYCQRYQCDRGFTGGLLTVGGSVSWQAGDLHTNTVGAGGTMSGDGVFSDTVAGGPLYWLPASGETLALEDVDLGSTASPDIAGAVEYDGEGVTTVTCDEAGCW